MKYLIITIFSAGLLCSAAVPTNYDAAKIRFDQLSAGQQVDVTLNLIATGDFEGLMDFGFTNRLYSAVVSFEQRQGLKADGILENQELAKLQEQAEPFFAKLGGTYYTHPATGTKLLVPRRLFDHEQKQKDNYLFSRDDRNLSLSFIAFPASQRSFADLYATMTSASQDRVVTYTRLFKSHFVVTGTFRHHKFYTWISRYPKASAGFTISWSEAWNEMGRKLATLLANTLQANVLTAENHKD